METPSLITMGGTLLLPPPPAWGGYILLLSAPPCHPVVRRLPFGFRSRPGRHHPHKHAAAVILTQERAVGLMRTDGPREEGCTAGDTTSRPSRTLQRPRSYHTGNVYCAQMQSRRSAHSWDTDTKLHHETACASILTDPRALPDQNHQGCCRTSRPPHRADGQRYRHRHHHQPQDCQNPNERVSDRKQVSRRHQTITQ